MRRGLLTHSLTHSAAAVENKLEVVHETVVVHRTHTYTYKHKHVNGAGPAASRLAKKYLRILEKTSILEHCQLKSREKTQQCHFYSIFVTCCGLEKKKRKKTTAVYHGQQFNIVNG